MSNPEVQRRIDRVLCTEFHFKPNELNDLTWDDIFDLYLYPREEDETEPFIPDNVLDRMRFHEWWNHRGLNWTQIESRWQRLGRK